MYQLPAHVGLTAVPQNRSTVSCWSTVLPRMGWHCKCLSLWLAYQLGCGLCRKLMQFLQGPPGKIGIGLSSLEQFLKQHNHFSNLKKKLLFYFSCELMQWMHSGMIIFPRQGVWTFHRLYEKIAKKSLLQWCQLAEAWSSTAWRMRHQHWTLSWGAGS